MTFITVSRTVPAGRALHRSRSRGGAGGAIEGANDRPTAGAIWFRGYVPGLVTAPFLFVTGALVLREIGRGRGGGNA